MLTLYTWTTPNGYKVPILLEELGLAYEIKAVDIVSGEQKTPEYVAINPNNKIPALVDDAASNVPLTIFESGAILMYLAEKNGTFFPQDERSKYAVIEWLMFQMGGVGPMFGQANFFIKFAKEKIPYAIERYTAEAARLCKVMDARLAAVPFLAGEYSIADMATWTWVKSGTERGYVDLSAYPNLKRWYDTIGARDAVKRAIEKTDLAASKKKEKTS